MKTTVAAVVCIFALFMVCGTILVILERDEIAATLFTSGISFLMGCGITVITGERDSYRLERRGEQERGQKALDDGKMF